MIGSKYTIVFKSYEDFHLLLTTDGWTDGRTQSHMFPFIKLVQGSYASGKCQGNLFFQGQGIVREFYVVSVKNVREMSGNFIISSLYNMMTNRTARAVFLTFYYSWLVFSTHHFAKC